MDTKLILLFIAIGLISTAVAYPKTKCGSGRTHDVIMGQRQDNDVLLYTADVKEESLMDETKSKHIIWPDHPIPNVIITRIVVIDQLTNGNGGCTYLLDGGVGKDNVHLLLETQKGGKFHFLIKVYGK